MLDVDKTKVDITSHFKIYLLWGITLVLAGYFFYFIINNAHAPSHGFASYYTASKLLSAGEDVDQFYNNDWFSSKVKNYVPEVYEIYHVNFPTTSLLLLPLSAFSYSSAKVIWTIFNLLIFIVTTGFMLKEFEFKKNCLPPILILVFLFQPLYANFYYGQAYIFIFCLLVLAWYAYKTDSDLFLGFLVGLIFIIKSTSFIFFIFLLIQKKWKSLTAALFTVLIVALLSLPWIGINAWSAYIEKFINFISHPTLSVTAYQTIHSFFYHFFILNQQWNPEPVTNLPALGKILSTLSILIVLIIISFKAHHLKKSDLAFGAFVAAGLIISPVSLDYHYTISLLPIFILISWVLKNQSRTVWAALILFIILIAAYIPYTSTKVTDGWLAILAYPKLYGAIGLLGLFMFYSSKHKVIAKGKGQIN